MRISTTHCLVLAAALWRPSRMVADCFSFTLGCIEKSATHCLVPASVQRRPNRRVADCFRFSVGNFGKSGNIASSLRARKGGRVAGWRIVVLAVGECRLLYPQQGNADGPKLFRKHFCSRLVVDRLSRDIRRDSISSQQSSELTSSAMSWYGDNAWGAGNDGWSKGNWGKASGGWGKSKGKSGKGKG